MISEIFRFRPVYKSVIWGGDAICRYKGVAPEGDRIGESWELSAVEGRETVVDGGSCDGLTLSELCRRFGADLLGSAVVERYGSSFPLLVKLIDARDNLSLQVHPDDRLAAMRHNSLGKTEMWHIIASTPDARIYCGLQKPLDKALYRDLTARGLTMEAVAAHRSAPGQFYYIPAGTLHAIGAGNLLAEIQQSSDITYRVYDYDRRDADGKPRELHTEQAADAIDYTFPPTTAPCGEAFEGSRNAAVVSDRFVVDYIASNSAEPLGLNHLGRSFAIFMAISGSFTLEAPDAALMEARAGTTLLIPAALEGVVAKGKGTALHVTVP